MGIIPEGALGYIGVSTETRFASDAVERGAVRRFVQAVMDDDPIYYGGGDANERFGGGVAPPLFPQAMFRRDFGEPDLIQENARDPDFDGNGGMNMQGLPEIKEFRGFGVLNGGSEIEVYRYARHGERVVMTSKYEDIVEKETSKGPIVLIIFASEFKTEAGELLLIVRRTSIRRPA